MTQANTMSAFVAPNTLFSSRPRYSLSRVHCCASSGSDSQHILRAVELAKRAVGQTRPNPPVGCVIVRADGTLAGEGFHARAGSAHAEIAALADAADRGNSVRGATAYVTLEPCNHFGRTPPCSRALVHAGVKKVVVGIVDPNPKVAGGGIRTLQRGGVEVKVGVEEAACADLAEGFVRRVKEKRPMGVLKYAMTLDGKIASESGSSKWVTGEHARGRVQEIRRGMDAIIVGGETMRKDDPRLTVRDGREIGLLQPIRVVMSRTLQLPKQARMWQTANDIDTVVLTRADHGQPDMVRYLREMGVVVEEVPGLSPDDAMAYLYSRDCLNVLWECGGGLAASAIRHGAVQKVHAFVAPKFIGGKNAPSPVDSPNLGDEMKDALKLENRTVETFSNGDILISGHLEINNNTSSV